MVRVAIALALLFGVFVLTWMSFLRVNNLAHDVKVLQEEVARLKGEAPPRPAGDPDAASEPEPARPVDPPAATPVPPAATPAATPAVSAFDGLTAGYLDGDRPEQSLPLPGGPPPRAAEVRIVAVQGEGASEVVLPDPITLTLRPGVPVPVAGICQGPETAAWVFTLDRAAIRVRSSECEYPVRGLRPRLEVRLSR